MANLFTGIVSGLRFFFENPLWTLALVIGILLIPLEVVDIVLWVLVNILVLLVNIIIFLLFLLFNLFVFVVNGIISTIFNALSGFGLSGTAPQLNEVAYVTQDYIEVNLFNSNTNILIIILQLLGRSLPLW